MQKPTASDRSQTPDVRVGVKSQRVLQKADANGLRASLGNDALRGAFRVNSMRPLGDLLVVTNARMALLNASDVGKKGLKVNVLWRDVTALVPFGPFASKVVARVGDEEVKLGSLLDTPDRETFLDLARHLRPDLAPAPTAAAQQGLDTVRHLRPDLVPAPKAAPGEGPRPDGDASRLERRPVLSTKLATTADALLAQAEAFLLPDEVVTGLFPLGPVDKKVLGNLLVVTNARLVGGVWDKATAELDPVWTAPVDQIIGVTQTSLTKELTIQLQSGDKVRLGAPAGEPSDGAVVNLTAHLLEQPDGRVVADANSDDSLPVLRPTSVMRAAHLDRVASLKAEKRAAEVAERAAHQDRVASLKAEKRAAEVAERTAHLSQAAAAEVAGGFPLKHAALIDPLLDHLAAACAAADRGDVLAEEAALLDAANLANKAGTFGRYRPRRWLANRIAQLTADGRLRRTDLLGSVGGNTRVYADRILHGTRAYLLDADVVATVEIDGQVLQSTRPTMSRMAAGAVLPGSALLVGLAIPKTEKKDMRKAAFRIVHPQWRIGVPLDPDKAPMTRGLAAQVNAIAQSKQRADARRVTIDNLDELTQPGASPTQALGTGSTGVADTLAQLERIAALEAAGHLSGEDAAQMRQRVIRGG
jgi:hypothetical protein